MSCPTKDWIGKSCGVGIVTGLQFCKKNSGLVSELLWEDLNEERGGWILKLNKCKESYSGYNLRYSKVRQNPILV